MRPVPLGIEPSLRSLLEELRSAVQDLQQPGKPQETFATTFASLPPADNYKYCAVLVTDKNCLATSTLSGGVWTWLRADGSAI